MMLSHLERAKEEYDEEDRPDSVSACLMSLSALLRSTAARLPTPSNAFLAGDGTDASLSRPKPEQERRRPPLRGRQSRCNNGNLYNWDKLRRHDQKPEVTPVQYAPSREQREGHCITSTRWFGRKFKFGETGKSKSFGDTQVLTSTLTPTLTLSDASCWLAGWLAGWGCTVSTEWLILLSSLVVARPRSAALPLWIVSVSRRRLSEPVTLYSGTSTT